MATSRFKNGKYRYTVRRKKLLPKPIYLSFENKQEGDAYVANLEALFDRGIVPPEYLDQQISRKLHDVIDDFISIVAIKPDSKKLLYLHQKRLENITMDLFTYDWCEKWIGRMKHQYNLAPSTITKHVGALARCLDWAKNKHYISDNHLRELPNGYATYTIKDIDIAGVEKKDIERNRRLEKGEDKKIRKVLSRQYKPKDKQRFLEPDEPIAMEFLFDLALTTAMRLREMYTIELSEIDLKGRTIFLTDTKNDELRQVPISKSCKKMLKKYLKNEKPEKYLFPWFRGIKTDKELDEITASLSTKWGRVFDHAECENLNFHDLRHEATSRIYENTTLSDIEISKITGHKTLEMLKRYANLRASNLAKSLNF